MKKNIAFEELSYIIVDSVLSENYLNRDSLTVKIKTILKAFNLKLNQNNYTKEKPSKTGRLIRAVELQNIECEFWKNQFRDISAEQDILIAYEKLNDLRLKINK